VNFSSCHLLKSKCIVTFQWYKEQRPNVVLQQEKLHALENETLLRKQEKPLQGRESVHLRQEKDLEENLQEELPEEDARSLPLFFINI